MYRFIIYAEPTKKNIIFKKDFTRIKDIIEYTNNKISYNDTKKMTKNLNRKNITYKSFLSVVKL
jgi:cytochrome b subunit of formate dehydrogenase